MDCVRIKVGFAQHPKTKALLSRLGYTGGFAFVCLLAWSASQRPDGDLSGLTDAQIEERAEWPGAPGVLIRELALAGFLVGLPGGRRIHDFETHNPISVMEREPPPPSKVPYEEIVHMYHVLLPALPRVVKLTAWRKAKIRSRWHDTLPSLDEWRKYFELVARSPFLLGQGQGRDGRRPFIADIDFLIRSEDMPVKIAEGKYHG